MKEILDVETEIRGLPLLKRIAFGAACSERLLPNYLAFSLIENWGDFSRLRNVLDLIWTAVTDESKWLELTSIDLDELRKLAPDGDNFSTLFTSLAGDAVASIVYTVEAYLDQDESIEKLHWVLQVMENSIYQFLAAVNDPEVGVHTGDVSFEDSIFRYPLMLAEMKKQREDLAYLRNNRLSEGAIFHLKSSSSKSGIQPLERGIVKRFFY